MKIMGILFFIVILVVMLVIKEFLILQLEIFGDLKMILNYIVKKKKEYPFCYQLQIKE